MKNLRYYIDLIEQGGTTTIGTPTAGSTDTPGSGGIASKLAGKVGSALGSTVANAQVGAAKMGSAAGAFSGGYNLAKQALKNPEGLPLANNPEQQKELDAIVQKSQQIQKDQDDLGKNIQGLQKSIRPTVA
jgi:hypothetical protein